MLVLPLRGRLPGAILELASGFAVVGSPVFNYIHTAAVVIGHVHEDESWFRHLILYVPLLFSFLHTTRNQS